MDRTEPTAEPTLAPLPPPERDSARRRATREGEPALRSAQRGGGSQAKIPTIFFWILGAAVLLRIVTAVADRGKADAGAGLGLVRWRPHESALAAAQTAGKPILYDFTAAWCAPCHLLDSEGWGDSRVAAMVNDGFLPARVVDRETEDGKNSPAIAQLERRYSVGAFPTLLVADASGREIARMQGYGGRDRLIAFLEEAKKKAGR